MFPNKQTVNVTITIIFKFIFFNFAYMALAMCHEVITSIVIQNHVKSLSNRNTTLEIEKQFKKVPKISQLKNWRKDWKEQKEK